MNQITLIFPFTVGKTSLADLLEVAGVRPWRQEQVARYKAAQAARYRENVWWRLQQQFALRRFPEDFGNKCVLTLCIVGGLALLYAAATAYIKPQTRYPQWFGVETYITVALVCLVVAALVHYLCRHVPVRSPAHWHTWRYAECSKEFLDNLPQKASRLIFDILHVIPDAQFSFDVLTRKESAGLLDPILYVETCLAPGRRIAVLIWDEQGEIVPVPT